MNSRNRNWRIVFLLLIDVRVFGRCFFLFGLLVHWTAMSRTSKPNITKLAVSAILRKMNDPRDSMSIFDSIKWISSSNKVDNVKICIDICFESFLWIHPSVYPAIYPTAIQITGRHDNWLHSRKTKSEIEYPYWPLLLYLRDRIFNYFIVHACQHDWAF